MRWSGRGNGRAGDRLQLRTGCGLARWTVLALTMCSVGALEQTQLDAWQSLYDGTGGASWRYCSDKRADPCSCTYDKYGTRGVTCVGQDITKMDLYYANLQGIHTLYSIVLYCDCWDMETLLPLFPQLHFWNIFFLDGPIFIFDFSHRWVFFVENGPSNEMSQLIFLLYF